MDKKYINKKVAELIAFKRNQNKFSQKILAEKIGMDSSVLAKIEINKRDLRFYEFVKINNILHFKESELKDLFDCQNTSSNSSNNSNILTIYQSYLKKDKIKISLSIDEKKKLMEEMIDLFKYINSL